MKIAVITFVVVVCLAVLCSAAEEEEPPPCRDVCPMTEAPVCGRTKDGERKTFTNQCKLNVYNCQNPAKRYNVIYRKACTR
ncbi:vasotab-like [Hetaerina americana]|uniref:vasotab-like n=1 Tax=Hetaerina americana TaxID=62018 RepID=UPI003A7F3528